MTSTGSRSTHSATSGQVSSAYRLVDVGASVEGISLLERVARVSAAVRDRTLCDVGKAPEDSFRLRSVLRMTAERMRRPGVILERAPEDVLGDLAWCEPLERATISHRRSDGVLRVALVRQHPRADVVVRVRQRPVGAGPDQLGVGGRALDVHDTA